MCRSSSTTNNAELPSYPEDRDRLKIRAFCLRLWVVEGIHDGGGGGGRWAVPEKLTLAYLPGIGGGGVEVNGSKVRDGAPAVVALRRVRPGERGLLFASTDRVRLGDGARFEACAGEEKVVSGVFRRGGGGGGAGWRMEWRGCEEGVAAEVWAVVGERVEVAAEEKGRRRRRTALGLGWFRSKLEEIPEESDGADDQEEEKGRRRRRTALGLGWFRSKLEEIPEEESDGADDQEGVEGGDLGMEMEMEGVRWAVDVGIWVVCLGVGLLVSRASASSFSRKRLF